MELFEFDPPQTWEEFIVLKNKLPYCTPETVRFNNDLNFYRQYLKETSRETRLKTIYDEIGDTPIKIIPNNFPYLKLTQHLGQVNHYCLWSKTSPLSNDQVEVEIKKIFPNKIYLWFENAQAIKSIPEIWHCHVFIKED